MHCLTGAAAANIVRFLTSLRQQLAACGSDCLTPGPERLE